MNYPRIYLAIDNCFAAKRWTKPAEWLEVIRDLGVYYVEASADNECDPLYTCEDYLQDWTAEIKDCSRRTGVKVANLYSGHGTYTTLGLAHHDARLKERFLNHWLKAMLKIAAQLDAGLGFFCHAFSDQVLQSGAEYERAQKDLFDCFAELAAYSRSLGGGCVGVEQMYTPHQIPWTIQGAVELLKQVSARQGGPFYITIDTGHQTGQRKFIRPGQERIKEYLRIYRAEGKALGMWLGPRSAYEIFRGAAMQSGCNEDQEIAKIQVEMDKYPYLFAEDTDGNPYRWLEILGCYSPIIHLQQTNGKSSSHQPFTGECNKAGIINGTDLLKAVFDSYRRPGEEGLPEGLPPKCEKIYLTLEIFAGTADINTDLLWRLQESVKYWRNFIPEDGLRLDQLVIK